MTDENKAKIIKQFVSTYAVLIEQLMFGYCPLRFLLDTETKLNEYFLHKFQRVEWKSFRSKIFL